MRNLLIIFIVSLTLARCGVKANEPSKDINIENLYGDWNFIYIYEGKFTKVDTTKKERLHSPHPTIKSYYKDMTSQFRGSYIENSTFKIKRKYTIHQVGNGKDKTKSIGRILFLDSNYLLMLYKEKGKSYTYLYKKR